MKSIKLLLLFQLALFSSHAQTTGQGSDDGRYRATVSNGVYEGKYDAWIKIYDSTIPGRDPIVMFYDLLGIEKYAYLKFVNADQFLLIAGANRIVLFDISNNAKVHEVGGFKGITSIAYLSRSRKLDVFEKGGMISVDLSNYIPETAPSNVIAAQSEKALLDYLMNVAIQDQESFNIGFNHILLNENYIYPFIDDALYLTSFNANTKTVKSDYNYLTRKIVMEESLGKVEYSRSIIGQSINNVDQLLVYSYLVNSFDKTDYIHFENYTLTKSNDKIYPLSGKSSKFSLKKFEPIQGSISEYSPTCVRLLNGNLLMLMGYDYETLSNQLYKDIGSGGLGTISQGKEIKRLYKLVIFDKEGQVILSQANYILPDKYKIRVGPGGTFALVSDNIFRPEKVQNISLETLKDYANAKAGIAFTLFDEKLNVAKFEQIEIKKDPRIEDARLIGSISNKGKLYILYASNQLGLLNKEIFAINAYSFSDGASSKYASSTILDEENYFAFDVGFSFNDDLFLLKYNAPRHAWNWTDLSFHRIKFTANNLEISEFKVPFVKLKQN